MQREIKEVYTELLGVCNKYVNESYLSDSCFDDIRKMKEQAENKLKLIEWYEKYDLDLLEYGIDIHRYNYCKIDDKRFFSYFANAEQEKNNGSGRYISWSDDGKQPKDEWLFELTFSTGAYIFGDDYPTELFQEFWNELKSYNPKYCDTTNNNMYFSLDNTKDIFIAYPEILKKYYEKNKEDAKQRRINKLKEELDLLSPNKDIKE